MRTCVLLLAYFVPSKADYDQYGYETASFENSLALQFTEPVMNSKFLIGS